MKWIISANYLDRRSPFKFLVRQEGEPVNTARAFKKVIGETVTVNRSSVESGFGCSTVMEAENVICTEAEFGPDFNSKSQPASDFKVEPEVKETMLKFNGNAFFGTNGKRVIGGEQVVLDENGMTMVKPKFSPSY